MWHTCNPKDSAGEHKSNEAWTTVLFNTCKRLLLLQSLMGPEIYHFLHMLVLPKKNQQSHLDKLKHFVAGKKTGKCFPVILLEECTPMRTSVHCGTHARFKLRVFCVVWSRRGWAFIFSWLLPAECKFSNYCKDCAFYAGSTALYFAKWSTWNASIQKTMHIYMHWAGTQILASKNVRFKQEALSCFVLQQMKRFKSRPCTFGGHAHRFLLQAKNVHVRFKQGSLYCNSPNEVIENQSGKLSANSCFKDCLWVLSREHCTVLCWMKHLKHQSLSLGWWSCDKSPVELLFALLPSQCWWQHNSMVVSATTTVSGCAVWCLDSNRRNGVFIGMTKQRHLRGTFFSWSSFSGKPGLFLLLQCCDSW